MSKKEFPDNILNSESVRQIIKIGKKSPFIFGISSTSLKKEEKDFFKKHKPLGVILFGKNIPSSGSKEEKIEQFKSLINELKSYGLIVFIDQEGGIVQRINETNIGQKRYSNCLSFGKMYEDSAKESDREIAKKACYQNFKEIGSELKNLGIDFTFAPVADLYSGESGAIRNRAFSQNPEVVIDLCKSAIKGLRDSRIGYCVKHAPGHGVAKAIDSHFNLPVAEESLEYLMKNDFSVFAELAKSNCADFVMTSHIIYSAIDKNLPATKSKACIDFMRNELGMKNSIIITDSINMGALHENSKTEKRSLYSEITKSCFDSGCDIVMEVSGKIDIMKEVIIK